MDFAKVLKQLGKVPAPIVAKVMAWEGMIQEIGLWEVRKVPGFHDEPLKGRRRGQRSIRLNRSWRLIYQEFPNGKVTVIQVQEVHKHDY